MRHVSPSCHGDAAGPVGASRDITEGLGDAIRNYDPSGGTGRVKSSRPDHSGRQLSKRRFPRSDSGFAMRRPALSEPAQSRVILNRPT
jgi:hypothetical protein